MSSTMSGNKGAAAAAETPARLFERAMTAMRAGLAHQARPMLETLTNRVPDHAKSRYALGIACFQLRDLDAAVAALTRALDGDLAPSLRRDALWHLALSHHDRGHIAETIDLAGRLVTDFPDYFGGFGLRGDLTRDTDPVQAEADLRRAVTLNRSFRPAVHALATLLLARGDLSGAADMAQRLLAIGRPDLELDRAIGRRLAEAGRLAEALTSLRRVGTDAAATDSDRARLVLALMAAGQLAEAHGVAAGLSGTSDNPQVAFARGLAAWRAGAVARAETDLQASAVAGVPWRGDALVLCGFLARQRGDGAAAARFYDAVLADSADLPTKARAEAEAGLGQMALDRGRLDEALARLTAAADGPEPDLRRRLDLLSAQHYRDDPAALAATAGKAMAALAAATRDLPPLPASPLPASPLPASPLPASPLPAPAVQGDRPLRLLHLGDWSRNQVQAFVRPVVAAYDRDRVQAIMVHAAIDGMHRPGLLPPGPAAADLTGLPPEQLAARLAAFEPDGILHVTANVHADALAAAALLPDRPHLAWGDVYGASGVETVGALVADAGHLPDGTDPDGLARTVHLVPGSAYVFEPPAAAPPVLKPPGRPLTFGSTHRLAKLGDPVLDLWARVLAAHDEAVLLVQATALDEPAVRTAMAGRFAARGIAPERLHWVGRLPHHDMLALYNRIDVLLDAQPWSGGLTTLEALWMGTPVVTQPGRSLRSRHAAAHLAHIGLDDLVAGSDDGFVAAATAIAGDPARRRLLAADLRDRIAWSPLVATRPLAAALAALIG